VVPNSKMTEKELNVFNKNLMYEVNGFDMLVLNHIKLKGKFTICLVLTGIGTNEIYFDKTWELIKEKVSLLLEINK
jgi:hypothetical protein